MSVLALIVQVNTDLVADVVEMDTFSWVFMIVCMTAVISMTVWCFARILRGKEHFDPDGTGPAHSPVRGKVDDVD